MEILVVTVIKGVVMFCSSHFLSCHIFPSMFPSYLLTLIWFTCPSCLCVPLCLTVSSVPITFSFCIWCQTSFPFLLILSCHAFLSLFLLDIFFSKQSFLARLGGGKIQRFTIKAQLHLTKRKQKLGTFLITPDFACNFKSALGLRQHSAIRM